MGWDGVRDELGACAKEVKEGLQLGTLGIGSFEVLIVGGGRWTSWITSRSCWCSCYLVIVLVSMLPVCEFGSCNNHYMHYPLGMNGAELSPP